MLKLVFAGTFTAAVFMLSGPTLVGAADAGEAPSQVVAWEKSHAILIRTVESREDDEDLLPLKPLLGDARVVALGEPAHGLHEPLAFRNRLFAFLVQRCGFTAIAIESGFPESQQVEKYVAGGRGAARDIARDNLTWGFGKLPENEELLRWMHDYNADPRHIHKVFFYGMDLSLGGPGGFIPTILAIENALTYLDVVDVNTARVFREDFKPYIRFMGSDPDMPSSVELSGLTATIAKLNALFEREQVNYVKKTSMREFGFAQRNVVVAREANDALQVQPVMLSTPGIPPDAWKAGNARNAAMAENVRWILEQQGQGGKILVFAHNAHVMNSSQEGGVWNSLQRAPNSMGQYLRLALGNELVIIGTSAQQQAPKQAAFLAAGLPSFDAVLQMVGHPEFMLDLHSANDNLPVIKWLSQPQTIRTNVDTYMTLTPGSSFDLVMSFKETTPSMR